MHGKAESLSKEEMLNYIAKIKQEQKIDWWEAYILTDPETLKPVYGFEWYKIKDDDTK